MGIFKKKKELDLLTAEEVGVSGGHKILPLILCGVVILLTFGVYLVLFLLNFSSKNQLDDAKAKVVTQSEQWKSYQQIASDIKIIQAKHNDYKKFLTNYQGLDKKIDKIRSVLPNSVYLTNLAISNSGKVSLTGACATPDEVYQFRDVLQSDKAFTDVGLESVSKTASSYTFNISFLVSGT